eukprot:1140100-Pyramimonas_sp.AAC.1
MRPGYLLGPGVRIMSLRFATGPVLSASSFRLGIGRCPVARGFPLCLPGQRRERFQRLPGVRMFFLSDGCQAW